jgi:hypothetical protein
MAFGRDTAASNWLDARRARRRGEAAPAGPAVGPAGQEPGGPAGQELARGETTAS